LTLQIDHLQGLKVPFQHHVYSAKNSGVRHFIFYSTVAVYGVHGDFSEYKKLINENSVYTEILKE
jgi:nucleoside-diphosphate-sugar epimerase